MDPISIAATCIALATTIGKVGVQVNDFCRRVRDARRDLDAVSRELGSIKTTVEIIAEDAKDPSIIFAPFLEKQIGGILVNCNDVVNQIQQLIEKYDGGALRRGVRWAVGSGREDIDNLRVSLEAHKSALELALELVTISAIRETNAVAREIKVETSTIRVDARQILGQTTELKSDTSCIIAEIERLRLQLSDLNAAPGNPSHNLTQWLDSLSSYADSGYEPSEIHAIDLGSEMEEDADQLSESRSTKIPYNGSLQEKLFGSSMPPINHDSTIDLESRIFNVAVIGRICAGKSTLMKLLQDKAHITTTARQDEAPGVRKGNMQWPLATSVHTLTLGTTTYVPVDSMTNNLVEVSKFVANPNDCAIRPTSPTTSLQITVNFIDTPGFDDSNTSISRLAPPHAVHQVEESVLSELNNLQTSSGNSGLDLTLFVISSHTPLSYSFAELYRLVRRTRTLGSRLAIVNTHWGIDDWDGKAAQITAGLDQLERRKSMKERWETVKTILGDRPQQFFIDSCYFEDDVREELSTMTAIGDLVKYISMQ